MIFLTLLAVVFVLEHLSLPALGIRELLCLQGPKPLPVTLRRLSLLEVPKRLLVALHCSLSLLVVP
jgi:hypothetical protein